MTATFLDYAARGKTSWWRYPVGFVVAVLIAILVGVALLVPAQLMGLAPSDVTEGLLDSSRPAPFFLLNGLIFGFVLVGFIVAARWLHGKRFGDVIGRWSWRGFGVGFGVWTLVVMAAAAIDFAITPSGFSLAATPQWPVIALAALAGLAVQTFAEEFVFRGYLTQGLLLALKRPEVTALVSGLLFGAMHIPNGVPHAVSASITGTAFAFIAMKTGGLAFTSGMHLANNLFAAVFVVSRGDAFRDSPGLVSQDTPHLMWWDTGVGAVGLVAVAFLVVRHLRRTDERP